MQSASTWLTAGSRPLAALAAGGLVAALGVRATFTVGTALMLVPVALLLLSPVRTLRVFPAAPQPPAPEGEDGPCP